MNDYIPDVEFGENLPYMWFFLTTFYGVLAYIWLRDRKKRGAKSPILSFLLNAWFVVGYGMTIVSLV